jgi:hypothetical protein
MYLATAVKARLLLLQDHLILIQIADWQINKRRHKQRQPQQPRKHKLMRWRQEATHHRQPLPTLRRLEPRPELPLVRRREQPLAQLMDLAYILMAYLLVEPQARQRELRQERQPVRQRQKMQRMQHRKQWCHWLVRTKHPPFLEHQPLGQMANQSYLRNQWVMQLSNSLEQKKEAPRRFFFLSHYFLASP